MKSNIEELRHEVQTMHNCYATHVDTEFVAGMSGLNLAPDGAVEVFTISGHREATRCYAWSFMDGGERRIAAVLEVPPVSSAAIAVQAAIAAEARANERAFN